MKLKDVIKVLIDNKVLLCDYEITQGPGDICLSKNVIRHNKILSGLIGLNIYSKLVEGPKQNETKKEFHNRCFEWEKYRKLITVALPWVHKERKKLGIVFDDIEFLEGLIKKAKI